ncbi:MAG: hypothetical protein H6Q91_996 [Deltaproteobacteria bacterium]|nr:hypothetical protein [Deltaproteobacteria bacterium]
MPAAAPRAAHAQLAGAIPAGKRDRGSSARTRRLGRRGGLGNGIVTGGRLRTRTPPVFGYAGEIRRDVELAQARLRALEFAALALQFLTELEAGGAVRVRLGGQTGRCELPIALAAHHLSELILRLLHRDFSVFHTVACFVEALAPLVARRAALLLRREFGRAGKLQQLIEAGAAPIHRARVGSARQLCGRCDGRQRQESNESDDRGEPARRVGRMEPGAESQRCPRSRSMAPAHGGRAAV